MSIAESKARIPTCPHGTKEDINIDLIRTIDKLEKNMGIGAIFNSGYRCPACNDAAGGNGNSAHLRGLAVDISCKNSAERLILVSEALNINIRRIGIGKTFVHIDVDWSLPQSVMWLY